MIRDALDSLLSLCFHRLGFPFTPRGTKAMQISCTRCGKTWGYDWLAMRRGKEIGQ